MLLRRIHIDDDIRDARVHLKFCAQLYCMQIKEGRFFLHEHPITASTWELDSAKAILRQPGVSKVCHAGARTADSPMLPTAWLLCSALEPQFVVV